MIAPRIACIIAALALGLGCASDVPGIDPPAEMIRFPVSIDLLPDDRHLLVVNANYDLRFNGSTIVVVDTVTGKVLPEHTVRLASFAGELVVRADGKRGFVSSRTGSRITVLDIDTTASRYLTCSETAVEPGKLPVCGGKYLTPVAINPFGILVQEPGPRRYGCADTEEDRPETVFVTHINTAVPGGAATGVISMLRSPTGDLPYQLVATYTTTAGPNGIAQHPFTGTLYLTTRFGAAVGLIRPANDNFVQVGSIIVNELRQGTDYRGITFDPSGTRAYIVTRSIEARTGLSAPQLLVFDVECGPTGRELNRMVAAIDLGFEPGKVAYVTRPDGHDRIYVPCGGPGHVYVIDPLLNAVEEVIEVGDGAYDIVFTNGARSGQGVQRAFVNNFRADSISVIELDEDSPNFHREIAQIRANPRILP